MKNTFEYRITEDEDGFDITGFLLKKEYSSRLIRRIKLLEDGIVLDGSRVHTNARLSKGQTLAVTLPRELPSVKLVPTDLDLSICYEDQDLLIINKASGVPIHPSAGNYGNTLTDGLAWYLGQKKESSPCRIINRLDRDTTGLLIAAKHPLSACILARMAEERRISRRYLAIVRGMLPEEGTIDAPIGRTEDSILARRVDFENGEPARTHYQRLFYDPVTGCSLAAIRLETGRTHQIRVHMGYIGHPLPGDFLYHPDYRFIGRQALHSFRLDFLHPLNKKPIHVEAPLPKDMQFLRITSIGDLWGNDF